MLQCVENRILRRVSMGALSEHIQSIERNIRMGNGQAAREELLPLLPKAVPDGFLAKLANFCWRLDLPDRGLRILRRSVYPPQRAPEPPDPVVLAEYAQCLIKLGAVYEAEELLAQIPENATPLKFAYRASAAMSRWDYERAYPYMVKYSACLSPSSYPAYVARINLAATAICIGKYQSATILLRELLNDASSKRFYRLYGTALNLAAQACIARKKWKEVDVYLDAATRTLKNIGPIDVLYIRKWQAIKTLAVRGKLEPLRQVRIEATAINLWETVRQCDEYEALLSQNRALLLHLYYGTPYPHWRERLLKEFGSDIEIPMEYPWAFGGARAGALRIDALIRRQMTGSDQIPLRLLRVLVLDFYRPQRIPEIFAKLYPGEKFNLSVKARVYEALTRLRAWLRTEGIPLIIDGKDGWFRLSSMVPCFVVVPRPDSILDQLTIRFETLLAVFGDKTFTLQEAAHILQVSSRTTNRILISGIERGLAKRDGHRRAARYRIERPKPSD